LKWSKIHELLEAYEKALVQKFNMENMSILFGGNIIRKTMDYIIYLARVQSSTICEKYLGLMVALGKSKTWTFKSINELIWSHINGWNEKFLYQAKKKKDSSQNNNPN